MELENTANAGVLLLNLERMLETYPAFVAWTFSTSHISNGLQFITGPADQGAYKGFYQSAGAADMEQSLSTNLALGKIYIVDGAPLFNWKPFWGAHAEKDGPILTA